MSRKKAILLGACALCLAIVPAALAVAAIQAAPDASASGFAIPWWTVDGGGGVSEGGDYSLSSTLGQPDAGSMSGGGYTLAGGFWSEEVSPPAAIKLSLPLVSR